MYMLRERKRREDAIANTSLAVHHHDRVSDVHSVTHISRCSSTVSRRPRPRL